MAEYEHRNRTLKLLLLPSFGAATPGVFVLSAIIAKKIHCIWSGSYSVEILNIKSWWQYEDLSFTVRLQNEIEKIKFAHCFSHQNCLLTKIKYNVQTCLIGGIHYVALFH